MNAVNMVPANSMIIKQILAQNSSTIGISQPYSIVKTTPKIWAPALIRPEDVPSGSGYVSSEASSNPTGRYPVIKKLNQKKKIILGYCIDQKCSLKWWRSKKSSLLVIISEYIGLTREQQQWYKRDIYYYCPKRKYKPAFQERRMRKRLK